MRPDEVSVARILPRHGKVVIAIGYLDEGPLQSMVCLTDGGGDVACAGIMDVDTGLAPCFTLAGFGGLCCIRRWDLLMDDVWYRDGKERGRRSGSSKGGEQERRLPYRWTHLM